MDLGVVTSENSRYHAMGPFVHPQHRPFDTLTDHHRANSIRGWKQYVDQFPFVIIAPSPFTFRGSIHNSTLVGNGWCNEQNNNVECSECCLYRQAVSVSVLLYRVLVSPLVTALRRETRGLRHKSLGYSMTDFIVGETAVRQPWDCKLVLQP